MVLAIEATVCKFCARFFRNRTLQPYGAIRFAVRVLGGTRVSTKVGSVETSDSEIQLIRIVVDRYLRYVVLLVLQQFDS